MQTKTITGFRATNKLHIGNVFGTLGQLEQLNGDIFVMIVDLHAMTEFTVKQEDIIYNTKIFLSLLGDKKCNIYVQSQVQGLTDLMWILSSHCQSGDLLRMTQFKSKSNSHCGFLTYPLLMAADILILNADIVAVGHDQTQHIELTNKIAANFNRHYNKNIFNITSKKYISEFVIKDLCDAEKKMSKTCTNTKGVVFLSDSPEMVEMKIMKAKTDALLMPENIESIKQTRPEVYNLCLIFSLCSNVTFAYIEKNFKGKPILQFKIQLVARLNKFLLKINEKQKQITNEQVNKVLEQGKQHVNNIARQNIQAVKECIYIK